jgi:hypothetical protein
MSDFLVNLALRAAGIPTVVSVEVPASWNEAPGLTPETPEIEEIDQERLARKPIASLRDDRRSYDAPQAPPPERMGVAPLAANPLATDTEAKPAPPPAIHPDPSAPERIREIQAERREIVSEASPIPPIEIRETIREREIVREKVVEREARVETPHTKEKPIDAHPAIESFAAPKPDSEPALRDMIREVIIEKPPHAQPQAPKPATQTPISPKTRKSEAGREPAIETSLVVERIAPPRPQEIAAMTTPAGKQAEPAPPAPPAMQSRPAPPANPILRSETVREAPRVSPTLLPAPQPAPAPESPVAGAPEASKPRKPEKSVEVKIGSIEIRAAAPPPAPAPPEPHAAPSQPVEGFEAYRSMRQYSAWFRG